MDAPTVQFQCETVDVITEEKIVDVPAHSFHEDSVEVIMEEQIAEQSANIPVSVVKEEIVESCAVRAVRCPCIIARRSRSLGRARSFPQLQDVKTSTKLRRVGAESRERADHVRVQFANVHDDIVDVSTVRTQ